MTDEWERARLIPVSGISGAEEQERRGVSALLAALASVREFGRAITGPLGAPAGVVNCFIEVSFRLGDKVLRPDGVIQVSRGGRTWTCLVEAKTAANELDAAQVDAYLDLAKDQGFDTVLTVSNQILAPGAEHPVAADKRKLKKVQLVHLSWPQIHTEAEVQRVTRSVADPDQAWILSELVRYLEHPNSGARDFQSMGPAWVPVRTAVVDKTLRTTDSAGPAICERFGQLTSFAAMRLSRRLGVAVRAVAPTDPVKARAEATTRLVDQGCLTGTIKVPDAAGPIEIAADMRAGRLSCSLTVPAPTDGRQTTKVNWLIRQLSGAPDGLLIESKSAWSRGSGPVATLAATRADGKLLVADPQRDIRSFTLTLTAAAGSKRDHGKGSFPDSVLALVDDFYATVVQPLRPPPVAAPKPKTASPLPGEPPSGPIHGELPTNLATLPNRPTPGPAGSQPPAPIPTTSSEPAEALSTTEDNAGTTT
jgi:hypothetical protein